MKNPSAPLLTAMAKSADYVRVDVTAVHQALKAKGLGVAYGTVRKWFDPNGKGPNDQARMALVDLFGASMEKELELHRSVAPEQHAHPGD